VSTLVLRLKGAESFLDTSECTLRTHKRVGGAKSGLRDVKRADFFGIGEDPDLKIRINRRFL